MYRNAVRPDELYHFGILGMKWGIRRYQNKDGSLTSAGRVRYGVPPVSAKDIGKGGKTSSFERKRGGSPSAKEMSDEELQKYIKRESLERSYNKLKGDPYRDAIDAANAVTTSSNVSKHTLAKSNERARQKQIDEYAKKIKKQMDSMSDQELQRVVNRQRLERQYAEAVMPKNKTNSEKAWEVIDKVGDIAGTAASVILVASAVAKVAKHAKKVV